MTRSIARIRLILFLIVATAVLISATSHIQAYRKQLPPELVRGEAFMVSPELLKIVSGEFRGLLADYLLLKAAVIDGGEPEKITDEDWEAIYVLYRQSMELDPRFYTTAYYTQGNLAWRDGMTENAVKLLELSADHRPWDWNPQWFLGFDYAHLLKNKDKAVEHLLKASAVEGAPPIFGILAARIRQDEGQTETSIVMLKAMYNQTDDEALRSELKRRIDAHIGVYQLEQAIAAYTARFQKRPDSLDDLIHSGVLAEMPVHPYDGRYFYDAETGTVDYGEKKR